MRKLLATAVLLALAASGPSRAAPPEPPAAPDEPTPSQTPMAATPEEPTPAPGAEVAGDTAPYVYPVAPARPIDWVAPDGWRYPALAGDALVVRPLMVAGLIGGGALFVATLPISAATGTTGDWLHTLRDRADDAFHRPLGAF